MKKFLAVATDYVRLLLFMYSAYISIVDKEYNHAIYLMLLVMYLKMVEKK